MHMHAAICRYQAQSRSALLGTAFLIHGAGCMQILSYLQLWMIQCRFYGEVIPGYVLSDRIASYVHLFNLYWYVRYASVFTHVQQ